MEFKNKPNEEVKTVDGRTVWLSRSPAIVAVIFANYVDKHGKHVTSVLVQKRSDTMMDAPGKWALISGYLDWGETGPEGLKREVYEESGINLEEYSAFIPSQPFYVKTDPKENRQNVALSYCIVLEFLDQPLPLKLKKVNKYKDSEIAELKWIPISEYKGTLKKKELAKYDWAFDHDRTIERAVFKHNTKINFNNGKEIKSN